MSHLERQWQAQRDRAGAVSSTPADLTTTYDVRFVGRIWQGVTCAKRVSIPASEVEQPPNTLEAIRDYLDAHERDFREITALDVEGIETEITRTPVGRDGWTVRTERSRITQLAEFNDDDAAAWDRAMFGELEDANA